MPPGAKKSWRFGRFSRGAGVIEMGAEMDTRWADFHDTVSRICLSWTVSGWVWRYPLPSVKARKVFEVDILGLDLDRRSIGLSC
jgi:hypothetical protein